jgi:hypothetical protein
LVRTSIEGQSIADGFYEKLIGSTPLPPMSASGQKRTYAALGGCSAPKYLVYVFGRPTENGFEIGAVGQKPANLCKNSEGIYGWQSIARGKFHDQLTVVYQQSVGEDNQAPAGFLLEFLIAS